MKKLEPLSRLVLHDVARKFQPDETLAGGEVWQHEAMRARMCVDAQVSLLRIRLLAAVVGTSLVNLKKQNGPATHLTLLHKGRL